MITDVRPSSSVSNACSIRISLGRSMFDVASSRIRIRGSARSARAIEMSCRSPAERPEPPSRTTWSRPSVEAGRDPVDADRVRRGRDLLVGRLGPPEADVVGDRAAEQERVLEDDAELPADRAQLHVAQIGAVDAHGALERVVEARDQLRGRRLAAARLADERDAAALGHVDRDAVDDRLVAVGEDDVVELEVARDVPDLGRAGLVGDVLLGVEHGRDLRHRGARRLHLAVELRELLERLEDELQHADRRDQRPDLRASRRRSASRPANRTTTVAITPRNSIAGKKIDESFCA